MNKRSGGAAENPLAAAYYADQARQFQVEVAENVQLATDTWRVRLQCAELAAQICPGQFLMIRLPNCADPLLGRPFALYDTVLDEAGKPSGVDVVYLVVGKMTHLLANCQAGDSLEVWGPLGNGFSAEPVEHLIMVAGGIGQTPMLALGRQFLAGRSYGQPPQRVESSQSVTLCYGVRRADLLAGADDFRGCGIDLQISSDDGSIGHHGLVTGLLEKTLDEKPAAQCRIACCGPEPMMDAVAKIALARGVACEVSLETPMACGIGICFSCVVKTTQPGGDWDYKRTCVDGPVFAAEKIVW
ncbi:MAG: dihydroorotate dehydrogenase electron transfer subunit [Bythopirellula sp.]